MNRNFSCKAGLSFLAIIVLVFLFHPGQADALTITPIRFEVSGNPGDVLNEELLLVNETDVVEAYYASFANFEAQGESGTPAFVEPKDDVGTWISTSISSISLAPHQQK